MNFNFLRSNVSHKIIALFIAAALIPILITAVLAYQEVSRVIEQERSTQLHRDNNQLSMLTYERLVTAQSTLSSWLEEHTTRYGIKRQPPELLQSYLSSISILNARTGNLKLVSGKSDALTNSQIDTSPFSSDHLSLFTLSHSDNTHADIYFIRKLLANQKDTRFLIAKVNTDYLWPKNSVTYATHFTIVDEHGNLLHRDMKPGFDEDTLWKLPFVNVKTEHRIDVNDESYLVSSRNLALGEQFQSQDWTFISIQPFHFTLSDLNQFRLYFIPPVLLSLALISFITLIFIRRYLTPITNLIEGTRQIASNNLDHQIEVNTTDELGALANSFNNMTRKLKVSINSSKALSRIDQLILANADIDDVAASVLSGFQSVIPAETVSFVLIPQTNHDSAIVYTLHGSSSQYCKHTVSSEIDIKTIPDFIPTSQALRGSFNKEIMNILVARKCAYIHSVPIKDHDRVLGWLIASNPSAFSLGVESFLHVKGYSDRVAVALAALTRSNLLAHQANMDSLTGIPNRRQMKILADRAIKHAVDSNTQGALLFIDLDRFKNVNDAFGHSIGDQLLIEAAKRLSSCMDGNQIVSRFGGDEFAILIPKIEDINPVEQLVMKVIKSLSTPFQIENFISYVGASAGVSLFPCQADNFDDLLQMADTAMYQAKREGRDNYVIYRPEFGKKSLNRSVLEHEIRKGLQDDAFDIYYQPKVSAWTGEIKGFEALLRWQHKKIGFVSPVDIISVAEESALINSLGDWIMRRVCQQIKDWQKFKTSNLTFAVNVSSKQLMNDGYLKRLEKIIQQTGINPNSLEIEITESLFLSDKHNTAQLLNQIHALGIKISIDDFGTGFSSLGYLSDLPIDTLKIDRCFIERLDKPDNNGAIVKTILAMASNLNLNVVAEGVETSTQLRFLIDALCDEIQGYFFSKPLTAEEAGNLLRNADQFIALVESVKTQRSQARAG